MGSLNIIFDNVSDRPLLACLGIFVCYFLGEAIYNIWFHPLARYPGPFFTKISSIPNLYHAWTGNRHVWLWQLHQIYGDAARYRPNNISFNTPSAYRTIYNNKAPVKKGSMYGIWAFDQRWVNTFTVTDLNLHSHKRKILNNVFSDKALHSAEAFIVKHVDRWIELSIDDNGETWSKPKNISEWADYLILDILGELCFGVSLNTKEPGDNPFKDIPHANANALQIYYPISQSPMVDLWLWLKPRGLDAFLALIMPPEAKRYIKFIEESVQKRAEAERELQKQGPENERGHKDMFHYIFNAKDPESGAAQVLSPENLLGEANLLVLAGSDTTAVVLAGFFFYSTRNPRVLEKLTREIRTSFSSVDEIRWAQKLSSLPYLRACINETLRMCPGTATDLDREILTDMNIDSWPVPRGVHVSCSSWCIPQNENSFHDPTVFRPERFIIDEQAGVTADDVERANESFFPFSIGPFNCAGRNLAIMELSVTIARTLYRLDFRLVPGDRLGEGSPGLGWGRRNRRMFQFKDAFISLRTGPMVQFRERLV